MDDGADDQPGASSGEGDFSEVSETESLYGFFSGDPDKGKDNAMAGSIDTPSSYPWASLRHREIRLMSIPPAHSWNEPLRFGLETYSLDDNPKYLTLSYAWGFRPDGSHLSQTAFANDLPILITEHLDAALRWIRELQSQWTCGTSAGLLLWVDAICINQKNPHERSSQVRMMGDIYRNGISVIVWLGDKIYLDDCPELVSLKRSIRGAGEPDSKLEDVPEEVTNMNWFCRRWVLQEYTLSRRRDFLIKDRVLGASKMPATLRQKYNTLFEPNTARTLLSHLARCQAQAMSCSDPLDYVYSLLSISQDRDRFCIDYSQSVRTVFVSVAQQYVLTEIEDPRSVLLLLLSAASTQGTYSRILPSWVPDWTGLPMGPTPLHSICKMIEGQRRSHVKGLEELLSGGSIPESSAAILSCFQDMTALPYCSSICMEALELRGIVEHNAEGYQSYVPDGIIHSGDTILHLWDSGIAFTLRPVPAPAWLPNQARETTFQLKSYFHFPFWDACLSLLEDTRYRAFGLQVKQAFPRSHFGSLIAWPHAVKQFAKRLEQTLETARNKTDVSDVLDTVWIL